MRTRNLTLTAAFAGALVLSTAAAEAFVGQATGSVNMRTGPSTAYPVITTIPAGARVEVFDCASWCNVGYAGVSGWASASYIATGFAPAPRYRAPRARVYQPPVVYAPPPVYVAPPVYYPAPVYRPGIYGYYSERDRDRRDRRDRDGASFEFGIRY